MGVYINKGNEGFRRALNSEYVDKTGLIAVVNKTLDTERAFTCVTRSRRFGKSMAVDMLRAYYDKSCDSRYLFKGLKISDDPSFEQYLNKFPVISLDITDFTTRYHDASIVDHIQQSIIKEMLSAYPDVRIEDGDDLMDLLIKIHILTGEKFLMFIDEWDAICREFSDKPEIMDRYVNMLRRMFKGGSSKDVFVGVYMTGILPIKRYNTESAMNNFWEYSAISPCGMESYFGFTPSEVERLAEKSVVTAAELREWYDGYSIGNEPSVYNPYSVIQAVTRGECESHWLRTGAFTSVASYINMNFEGLKDDILYMLGGGHCDVDVMEFENDPAMIRCKDDVLTILIHLGYLAYDRSRHLCYVPNKEVSDVMERAVKACNWEHVNKALNASKALLYATLSGDEAAVAANIDLAHDDNTSILSFNDENSLACVISIAYYYAKNDYIMHREYPTGKGLADIVFMPRPGRDLPALVIELKYNKSAEAAIEQIRRKQYPAKMAEYTGSILLVGINYNKETKVHSCRIERVEKT